MTNEPKAGKRIDPEMLAAYIENRLPPDQRAAVEAQLATDPESYALLVDTVEALDDDEIKALEVKEPLARTIPFAPKAATPRVRMWVLASGALAAAAAMTLVMWTGPDLLRRIRGERTDPLMARLVDAVGEERYIEARMSGGFRFGELRTASRGTADAASNLAVVATAGQLQVEARQDSAAAHALAVALVFLGRTDEGIAQLESLVQEKPSARLYSDLAAAYLTRASPIEHPADVPKAMNAAERATELDPSFAEGWFNLALALERLQLRDQAAQAWSRSLELESGPWRTEIQRKLDALRSKPQGEPSSGPRADARNERRDDVALRVLEEGKSLYRRYLFAEALPLLQEASASLARHDSPLRFEADAYLGVVYHHLRRVELAEPLLRRTAERADGVGALQAVVRARMGLGILVGGQGRFEESLQHYRLASDAARRAGDALSERYVSNLKAEVLHLVGEYSKAWREVNIALPIIEDESDYRRRLSVLFVASVVAVKTELPRVARRFQEEFIATAHRANVPISAVEGHIARARASTSLNDIANANRDLVAASALIAQHQDLVYNEFLTGELHSTSAELFVAEPQRALAEVTQAIDYMRKAHRREKLPKLYLLQARMNQAVQKLDDARASLASGFDALLQHVNAVGASRLSFARVESAWDLVGEWLAFQVSHGRERDALVTLESLWSAMWNVAWDGSFESARSELAADVTFVYYVPTPNSILVWTVRREAISFHVVNVNAAALSGELRELDRFINDDERLRVLGHGLLAPISEVIRKSAVVVICPVGVASRVPWPILTTPWSGRPLLHDVAVALTPGLTVTRAMTRTAPAADVNTTLLFGGSPSPVVANALGLSALPGARQELRELHAQIPRSTLVTDDDATPEKFRTLASQFDVVHFAGHALYREAAPDESSLVLHHDSPLYAQLAARDIARMNFERTRIVVLAACETVGGQSGGTEGPIGLGKSFLVAGAELVIGTRWPVPDEESRILMLNMHRLASRSGDYVQALRRAIVECSGSQGGCPSKVTWAAYVAIGSSPFWFNQISPL
ncbi:MAG TPA: CHAT domain-containing tetratricopeptide repeat protein [Vicinamibacterales bacterium]|nr:CHAT domain-containing tetratricopeptide repeat protein [Vicinamibacterales bacterium]